MNKKTVQLLCLVSILTSSISFAGCSSLKYNSDFQKKALTEKEEPATRTTFSPIENSKSKDINENKSTIENSTNNDLVNPTEEKNNEKGQSTISNPSNKSDNYDKINNSDSKYNPTNSESNLNKDTSLEKVDFNELSNNKIGWWFKPNKSHVTPEVNTKIGFDISKYDAHYVGNTSRKVLYLTFDEGYENGYTGKILDTLKECDVKAMFFVTLPYLKANNDLILRMIDEGHIVANHTNHHPSMPTVAGSEEKFNKELKDVEEEYKRITNKDMPKFFRPPMGEYSHRTLAMTKNLGYQTIFWSFAYHDWDINKQPSPEKAKKTILDGLHNGSIMLIHAVSKTNTEVLEEVLKEAKAQGYVFELLP
ncbi:MAG: delta-lactam-biosynthetic de-N-acetylase [Clostridium sp.]